MNIQNMHDLRNHMIEELELLRKKKTTPAAANAAANISGKIMYSVKMELEQHKIAGTTPSVGFIEHK